MMKRVAWIASSREDLRQFPRPVQKRMGDALFAAQVGEKHDHAKPLKGFGGAAVLEIVERYDTDAYLAVYTVALSEAVYVLHAFQKKSKEGRAMPQRDVAIIQQRLQVARETDEQLRRLREERERQGRENRED